MLNTISKYRNELMGFSCIMVVLAHCRGIPLLESINKYSYGVVDVFLLLSGFGLYISLKKETSLKSFYKKRFFRIIPTYAFIIFISLLLLGKFTFAKFLLYVSTIGFWTGNEYFEWYIPSLFVFYITVPFIKKMVVKSPLYSIIFSIIFSILLTILRMKFRLDAALMLFITRIPIFFIGVVFGFYFYEKRSIEKLKKYHIYTIGVIGILFLYIVREQSTIVTWNNGLLFYPFIFVTPVFCVFFSKFLDKLGSNRLNKVLAFFGSISLEVFLVHFEPIRQSQNIADYLGLSREIILIITIVLTVPVAYLISKIISNSKTNFIKLKEKKYSNFNL